MLPDLPFSACSWVCAQHFPHWSCQPADRIQRRPAAARCRPHVIETRCSLTSRSTSLPRRCALARMRLSGPLAATPRRFSLRAPVARVRQPHHELRQPHRELRRRRQPAPHARRLHRRPLLHRLRQPQCPPQLHRALAHLRPARTPAQTGASRSPRSPAMATDRPPIRRAQASPGSTPHSRMHT